MKKNQNKTSMAKALGPFRDSQAPSWQSGSQTDVPAEPPSHRPCKYFIASFTIQVETLRVRVMVFNTTFNNIS